MHKLYFQIIIGFILFTLSYCESSSFSKTKLYDLNNNKYLSAIEYANSQNIHMLFYEDKEKLVLRFQSIKLIISPYSSFIKVNENIYHISQAVIYDGNDFFIPAKPFLEIINNIGMPRTLIDSSEKYIITNTPKYNILGTSNYLNY